MLNKIITFLGLRKHDYQFIGKAKSFSQLSSFYECTRCKDTIYVPSDFTHLLRELRGCKT
jgi:hypothetical protein